MAWTVKLDPVEVAPNRSELDLHDNTRFLVDQNGIDWGEAAIQAYMADEQRWGSRPVSYRVPNRNVIIPMALGIDGDSEGAARALNQKVALIHRRGGWLKRQREGRAPMYADVVNATLTEPDKYADTGDFEPDVNLALECLPDYYGDLITLDTVNGTGEAAAVLQAGGIVAQIEGDHPGRAQLTVLEGSGAQQFGLVWGFRSYFYNGSSASKLVWPAAAGMVPAAGATVSALAGGRGGQVITQAGIGASWKDLAYLTGAHVGSYQVWARCYSASPGVLLRLQWAIGDRNHGMITAIPPGQVALPAPGGFYLLNLGQVRLDPVPVGAQQWSLAIQGSAASGSGLSASVDMLYLQPLDENSGQLVGTSPTDPVMLGAGRLQMRHDGVFRAVAGGTVFTGVPGVGGDLPRIPPSGDEELPVELLVKPTRGDLALVPDSGTDNFSVAVSYRPSYLFPP